MRCGAVHHCPYPSAWLQLDEEDHDPTRVLDQVVTSLQAMEAEVGTGIVALLHLVVASREKPDIALGRLHVQGKPFANDAGGFLRSFQRWSPLRVHANHCWSARPQTTPLLENAKCPR